jgi:hypothetical protein
MDQNNIHNSFVDFEFNETNLFPVAQYITQKNGLQAATFMLEVCTEKTNLFSKKCSLILQNFRCFSFQGTFF